VSVLLDGRRPYAADPSRSRGRTHAEPESRFRSAFQRDRDRIIHSGAFRRLEYKTQVFVNHEGDMFRTRLTHTIEVAQVARTMSRALGLDEDLVEAIALAHDLGHTPFGHAGQDELNACMADHGGFEHNLQSLRVVELLEEKYATFPGLNLTFETREGILKHCQAENAADLGPLGTRFLEGTQPGLEAQLTNLADEIAYNSHDVDDGLRAGLLDLDDLRENLSFAQAHAEVSATWPDLPERRAIPEIIRRMIDPQVVDVIETSRAAIEAAAPGDIDDVRAAGEPLIRFSDAELARHRQLKRFLQRRLYRHYRVHRMSVKSRRIVRALYEAYMEDLRVLPKDALDKARAAEVESGESGRARAVADYIAGMTDRFAIAEYARLFDPARLT
jgi:dGTPase